MTEKSSEMLVKLMEAVRQVRGHVNADNALPAVLAALVEARLVGMLVEVEDTLGRVRHVEDAVAAVGAT